MNPTISARHADPYENAWVYDNPPFGLGLPRRTVVAELFLAIYDASRDGEGTWDVDVAEMSRIFNCAPRSIRRALSVLTARHLVRAVDTFIPAGKCARSKVTWSGPSRRLPPKRTNRARQWSGEDIEGVCPREEV